MRIVVAFTLVAVLVAVGSYAYVRTGARRWTIERDPLGQPPVRLAAAIAAAVIAIALISGGGGGAKPTSSMLQGLDEGDATLTSQGFGAVASSPTIALADDGTSAASRRTVVSATPPGRSAARPSSKRRPLPAYGRLVVRARKAAEHRGVTIRWYPSVVSKAEAASRRRAR